MRTFYSIVLFIIVSALIGRSQLLDSIKNSFAYSPRLLFKLEARNSFISSKIVNYQEIKAGLNFNNTTKVGIGYNWLNSSYNTIYDFDKVRLKASNALLFFEYNFFKKSRWLADIPVQIGIGRISYVKGYETIVKSLLFVYEPAMTIEYRIFRYVGLGFGAGYRFAIYSRKVIKETFNAPVYLIRFKVYFGDIYKQHFKKE